MTNSRRYFVLFSSLSVFAMFGVVAVCYGPAIAARNNYEPQVGDVVFQSLPRMPLVNAIEGVTESPFSHCGIVGQEDGKWIVYEALNGVEKTPLQQFLRRGRNGGFAVYRLKEAHRKHIPQVITEAKKFLGRPYDVRYRMDDEKIYCSELIYKAYHATTGDQLGELRELGKMNWKPFRTTIEFYEGGPVPMEREMITPVDMARATQLELVTSHAIRTPDLKRK